MKKSIIFLSAIIIGLIGEPGIAMENHFNTKNNSHTLLAALYKKEQRQNRSIADFVIPEDKKLVGPLAAAYAKQEKEKLQKNENFGKQESIQQFTHQIHKPISVPTFCKIAFADGVLEASIAEVAATYKTIADLWGDTESSLNTLDLVPFGITKKTFESLHQLIKQIELGSLSQVKELLNTINEDDLNHLFVACLKLNPTDELMTKLCAQAILKGYNYDLISQASDVLKKSNNVYQLLYLENTKEQRKKVLAKANEHGILDLSNLKLCSLEGLEDLSEYIDLSKIDEINLDKNYLQELSVSSLIKLFPQLKKLSAKNNLLTTCDLNELYLLESTDLSNNLIGKIKDLSLLNRYKYAYEFKKFLKQVLINLDGNNKICNNDFHSHMMNMKTCLLSGVPLEKQDLLVGLGSATFLLFLTSFFPLHYTSTDLLSKVFETICSPQPWISFSPYVFTIWLQKKINDFRHNLSKQKWALLNSSGFNNDQNQTSLDVDFSNNESYKFEISHAPGKEEESDEE